MDLLAGGQPRLRLVAKIPTIADERISVAITPDDQGRFELEKAVALVTARYPVGEIPRPPYWSGFRVTPLQMEFWHDRPFRLHERVAFRRGALADAWIRQRLYP